MLLLLLPVTLAAHVMESSIVTLRLGSAKWMTCTRIGNMSYHSTISQKAYIYQLASTTEAFACIEQLTYGESTVREIETFIVITSLAMVEPADGMEGGTIFRFIARFNKFCRKKKSGTRMGVFILLSVNSRHT